MICLKPTSTSNYVKYDINKNHCEKNYFTRKFF